MKHRFKISKRSGLVSKFSLLLLLSALAGVILYLCLFFGGQVLSETLIEQTSFVEKQTNRRIEKFQSYITKNAVSAMDSKAISAWERKNSVAFMEIYRGYFLIYSTDAPDYYYTYENTEEATLYDWATYHTVQFADGEAQIIVYADDMAMLHFGMFVFSAAAGLFLALFLFLSGCSRVVKQICLLNERIQRMEGGELNVDIPVSGDHELSQLARNLHAMRCAFIEQRNREMSIFSAHQSMITQMSHDLRTPLTILQIHTDILRYKKSDPDMLYNHLELMDAKICQIKQLADHIFEYSLVSGQLHTELECPVPAKHLFHDLLSEYISQWTQLGFHFHFDQNWPEIPIAVHSPFIKRLMDNIFSNLSKYASKEHPVLIKTAAQINCFCLCIQNNIRKDPVCEESTHIGLLNIQMMMQKMHGYYHIERSSELFSITLHFPNADQNPMLPIIHE